MWLMRIILSFFLVLVPTLALTGCGERTEAAGATQLRIVPVEGDPGSITVSLSGKGARELQRRSGADVTGRVFLLSLQPEVGATPPPPVLSEVTWSGGEARLIPRVSLTPGLTYRAVFNGPAIAQGLPYMEETYTVLADRGPGTTSVVSVHPTQVELPGNLLKFYVYFSEPMAEGRVFEHVRILGADGKAIPQAFNELELWADDHRRLTLWVNPGRTKRSLGLSESLGPVLEAHRRYSLEIDAGLTDQRGRPLSAGFQRQFRTAGFDRQQPRVEEWGILTPPPGSRSSLLVEFNEPLDRALAERCFTIENGRGEPVAGTATLSTDTARWEFVPAEPWQAGHYRLVARGELEDLAGNSLYRAFETSPESGKHPSADPPDFHRGFVVGSP